jgi:hypothetical protein
LGNKGKTKIVKMTGNKRKKAPVPAATEVMMVCGWNWKTFFGCQLFEQLFALFSSVDFFLMLSSTRSVIGLDLDNDKSEQVGEEENSKYKKGAKKNDCGGWGVDKPNVQKSRTQKRGVEVGHVELEKEREGGQTYKLIKEECSGQ